MFEAFTPEELSPSRLIPAYGTDDMGHASIHCISP
jgi:hypothetical protein